MEVGSKVLTTGKEKLTEISQNERVAEITEKSKQTLLSVGGAVVETSSTLVNKVTKFIVEEEP
jgi:hypothetical protein